LRLTLAAPDLKLAFSEDKERLALAARLLYHRRRTGGRVVDGTALEMRRACKGSVGSNPTLSAIKKGPLWALFYGGLGSMNDPPVRQNCRQAILGARVGSVSVPTPSDLERSERRKTCHKHVFRNPSLSVRISRASLQK
jgi:hypothetical protein